MLYAFKVGLLAFDATRLCAADVDFPMDVILYSRGSFQLAGRSAPGGPAAGLPGTVALRARTLSGYIERTGPVRELARSVAEGTGWQTLVFLTALNRSLFETFRHVVRDDGPPHPPEITFRTKEASCRDLTMLFCAACRSMRIAARFVSGYERGAALQKQAYMHAWAEVYLAGDGWRGYNPSQGLAVANSHVAVAAAADPKLAAPLSGSYWAFSGPASPTVVQAANILSSAFQRAPRPVRRLTCAVKGKDRADA